MATDLLTLGGVAFTDFSTPERMPFGGRQQLAVHQLIGGQRVIDALGPEERDIYWTGKFFGDNALSTCLLLDSMRAAGTVLPLVWGAKALTVVIRAFEPDVLRFPQWIEYNIWCVVADDFSRGLLEAVASGVDSLVAADLSAALALLARIGEK